MVDFPAALACRTSDPSLSGRLTLRIDDPLAPWNADGWRIEVVGGTVRAAPTGEKPELSCDIGAWSQLFFGDPDAAALRRAGRLSVHEERAFALLQALFPPALVWTNDGF